MLKSRSAILFFLKRPTLYVSGCCLLPSPPSIPAFRDQGEGEKESAVCAGRGKEGETYGIDMPLQRFPLFLVLLFSPSFTIVAVTRRNRLQSGEALIVQDIDAAVVRPEVVDLLVKHGDPDVFADEFDELENVGPLSRLLLCG